MNLLATLKNIFGKPEASEEDLIAEVNAAVEGNKKVDSLSNSIGELSAKLSNLEAKVGSLGTLDQESMVSKVSEALSTKVSDELNAFKSEAMAEVNSIKSAVSTSLDKGLFIPEHQGSTGQPQFRKVKY